MSYRTHTRTQHVYMYLHVLIHTTFTTFSKYLCKTLSDHDIHTHKVHYFSTTSSSTQNTERWVEPGNDYAWSKSLVVENSPTWTGGRGLLSPRHRPQLGTLSRILRGQRNQKSRVGHLCPGLSLTPPSSYSLSLQTVIMYVCVYVCTCISAYVCMYVCMYVHLWAQT